MTDALLSNLHDRVAALENRLRKVVLPARVAEVRENPYLVRLDLAPQGAEPELTDPVPVVQPRAGRDIQMWAPVRPGETGVLVSPNGLTSSGFFIPGLFSSALPPPAAGAERGQARLWVVGDLKVTGNVRVEGNLSVRDDMKTDPKGGYNGHTHVYVLPLHPRGNAETEAPTPS